MKKIKNKTKEKLPIWRRLNHRVENSAQVYAWFGTLCILLGYTLTSFNLISNTDPIYHGLNLIGAVGIISVTLPRHIYQSVFLNGIWAIVAIVSLLKVFTKW